MTTKCRNQRWKTDYMRKGKFETELIFFYAVCPAKLEAGLLGLQMQKNGKQF